MATKNDVKPELGEEMEKCVMEFLKEKGLTECTLDISAGSIAGDNYLGVVSSVSGKGIDKDGNHKAYHLFVKCAPKNEAFREYALIRSLYGREIYMYTTVFPEFFKLQEERGIVTSFKSLAVCYKTFYENGKEALIMKNMKKFGYSLKDRRVPLDYEHTVMVLKEYGRYHALSFALRDQQPELFKDFAKNTTDLYSHFGEVDQEYVIKLTNGTFESLDPIQDNIIYEKFDHFRKICIPIIKELLQEEAAGEYAAIGHGDCWTNNFLFKYEDSSKPNVPTEMCFLDFQLARCASPTIDLFHFIFTCIDSDLRDKHYEHFIQVYYNSLSSFLRELGSDPNKLFPLEVYKKHLKKFSPWGLYIAAGMIQFMMSESGDTPDISNMKEADVVGDIFMFKSKNEKDIQKRVRDTLYDYFVKCNYNI